MKTDELDDMIRGMQLTRAQYDDAKKISSSLHKEFKEQELAVMEALKSIDKKKYFVDDIGTISVKNTWTVTTPKTIEDKRALLGYIKDTYGDDTMVAKMTVNSNTLNAFYNEEMKIHEDDVAFVVPGLTEPLLRESLSVVKPRS